MPGWRWILVAGYMAALFVASSGPGPDLPSGHHFDKVLHAGAYAVLTALAVWAAARGRWRGVTGLVLAAAWIVSTAFGATDEIHQMFVPGREADMLDLAADATGAFAAAGAIGAWSIIARGSERPDDV